MSAIACSHRFGIATAPEAGWRTVVGPVPRVALNECAPTVAGPKGRPAMVKGGRPTPPDRGRVALGSPRKSRRKGKVSGIQVLYLERRLLRQEGRLRRGAGEASRRLRCGRGGLAGGARSVHASLRGARAIRLLEG